MKTLPSIVDLYESLANEFGLFYLRGGRHPARNELNEFTRDGINPACILKKLASNSQELDFYQERLPRLKGNFKVLQLPELLEIFLLPSAAYILLPYYDGPYFDFHEPDEAMAEQMVAVVKDLLTINVEDVISGGSRFNYRAYESKFWESFKEAIPLRLIHEVEIESFTKIAETILQQGRTSQRMIISNGDFNPRNLIRLNSRLVLIDWSDIVAPLEHHLTYTWLLNSKNKVYPTWRQAYASSFERELPVSIDNIRYHLMYKALRRAVSEENFYNSGEGEECRERAIDYMACFRAALEGFQSLTKLV